MNVRILSSLAITIALATRAVPQVTTAEDGDRQAGAGAWVWPASYRTTVAQTPEWAVPVAAEPVPAPPDAADKRDLSAFDGAAFEAPAMPAFRVVEHAVPVFRNRDLYTEDGMAALSFEAHPGLHVGNVFNLNRKAAYDIFLEDDWRATKSDYWDMAHAFAQGGDHGEGRMILEVGRFQIAAETGTKLEWTRVLLDLLDGREPDQDLVEAVVAKGAVAELARGARDLLHAPAVGDHLADLLRDDHELVEGHAPPVAGAAAVGASTAAEEGDSVRPSFLKYLSRTSRGG
jgi:hypothetical protein